VTRYCGLVQNVSVQHINSVTHLAQLHSQKLFLHDGLLRDAIVILTNVAVVILLSLQRFLAAGFVLVNYNNNSNNNKIEKEEGEEEEEEEEEEQQQQQKCM